MDEGTVRNSLRIGSCGADSGNGFMIIKRSDAAERTKLSSCFAQEVDDVVGPVLRRLGFELDEIDDRQDTGGRERHIVYYRSTDCKVQVYESAREREVNCMIAPVDVPNDFGLTAPEWQHVTKLSKRPDVPFKELLRAAREEYRAYSNPLYWVRDRIEQNFEAAHAAIVGS